MLYAAEKLMISTERAGKPALFFLLFSKSGQPRHFKNRYQKQTKEEKENQS